MKTRITAALILVVLTLSGCTGSCQNNAAHNGSSQNSSSQEKSSQNSSSQINSPQDPSSPAYSSLSSVSGVTSVTGGPTSGRGSLSSPHSDSIPTSSGPSSACDDPSSACDNATSVYDGSSSYLIAPKKPVLYLYPERPTDVSVKLDFDGRLTAAYPAYNGGWNVRAYPDGRLINKADGLEYSYLFWEGIANQTHWDLSEGYCVAGGDTAAFLQKNLSRLGLTPKEYNEFIVYWLPQMQDHPYNLITFQWDAYEKTAPLTITPAPDSMLRVFMVFVPLDKPMQVKAPAERAPFVRRGFTAVEWGGSETEYR